MLKEKIKQILTFNGMALIVGVLGSLASIMTVFVTKWNTQINLKWLIFTIFLSLAIILFLLKLVYDLLKEIEIKRPNTANAIRYITESKTLIVTKNEFLGYSAMVSIFYKDENYEIEFGKGYVESFPDNFVQIKVLEISEDFVNRYGNILEQISNNDMQILQKLIVKSYITYTN